jgi:hypothetical protein
MSHSPVRKVTPNLIVDAIEPCLAFWTERLGFDKTVEVPDDDRLGFVILAKDGVEIMYQTWHSVSEDAPTLAARSDGHSVVLFIEVGDLDAVERAMPKGAIVMPRRTTFYGMHEIAAREPGGNLVIFAQPVGAR